MEEFRRTNAMKAAFAGAAALALVAGILWYCMTTRVWAQSPEDNAVLVRNLATPGAFEVENSGADIELARKVSIQRYANGKWSDEVTDTALIERCGPPAPSECFHLAHGARFRPVMWNGLTCGSQCPATCRANIYLGPGRFRFVVSTCDGKRTFAGPAFQLPTQQIRK